MKCPTCGEFWFDTDEEYSIENCERCVDSGDLRCILELTSAAYPGMPGMLWLAQEQFGTVGRYFPGEDLVFAVGDIQ
jgi:hypothetical protein